MKNSVYVIIEAATNRIFGIRYTEVGADMYIKDLYKNNPDIFTTKKGLIKQLWEVK